MKPLTMKGRLKEISQIIESVDDRAMAADGPVTRTLEEMTQSEISRIYSLAKGRPIRPKSQVTFGEQG